MSKNHLPVSTADVGYHYVQGDPAPRRFHRTFSQAFESVTADHPILLDAVAIAEAVGCQALIGDRTIVRDIKRTPWLSKISPDCDSITDLPIPEHGQRRASPEIIAVELVKALRRELSDVAIGKKKIGILLSGGMDSRIVSAMLKSLQREGLECEVVAFCWGDPESRDPVYAKKIAEINEWQFEHLTIGPTTLANNIAVSANQGCAFAANHLHAMPDVANRAKELGIECMIAASYGDSIGRAEYSGRHVDRLYPIEYRLHNTFQLLNPHLHEQLTRESLGAMDRYHQRFGNEPAIAITELDYQLHYMRNQLGTCMAVIEETVPLFQAFTSLNVVRSMWSYHPDCRDDRVYAHVLNSLDPTLLEIPWARTGKRYLHNEDRPDALRKRYHHYGTWCRHEIADQIDQRIFSGELEKTRLFDMKQVEFLLKLNRRYCKTDNRNKFDEITLWLASFASFLHGKDWALDLSYIDNAKRPLTAYWPIIRYASTYVLRRNKLNA
jgi:asparagine synthase (glutamine-hydrolysing)